ncbi:OLC1v1020008C1 [Oldenlandia corymbosa var. corymbosa]|uniref:OLC1v1020008C1 n=1 Tax=Oldenlandia corymbosa var. corymbosa TaxID=529605 RepID=A0AAV1EFC5_OLDCO|nr:OLC1v1020008C1 [Oldenlandia corymbosa var. corymbosa]
MDYMHYESCVTDDLPPSRQKRVPRKVGRPPKAVTAARNTNNMEALIQQVQLDAYFSVLKAFKAQADSLSWEKESLITELRKELGLSDEEHRALLRGVHSDDVIRRIRKWRHSVHSVHYPAATPSLNPLIGRKVRTKWPEDKQFYEAYIADYKPEQGLHALVYDIGTSIETWEWVNISEIPPQDIIWDFPTQSQNGSDDVIQLLDTDSLLQEVERVLMRPNHQPHPLEIDHAKIILQEHEEALTYAIAKIAEFSDHRESGGGGGSGSGGGHSFQGKSSMETTQCSSMETMV